LTGITDISSRISTNATLSAYRIGRIDIVVNRAALRPDEPPLGDMESEYMPEEGAGVLSDLAAMRVI
jgi:hypothetical protein